LLNFASLVGSHPDEACVPAISCRRSCCR
jgi:hypothetical protein